MRFLLMTLSLLLLPAVPAQADLDVSVRIGIPGVRIGIDVPSRPHMVRVPGHPVFYDPDIRLNLFFYEDTYWVFQDGEWYRSRGYNGPWDWVDPYYVPVYVLVVPVRYYRVQPPFFRGWQVNEPPRWGHHWGHEWQDRRKDWDRRHDHDRRDDRGDWDRRGDRGDWDRRGDRDDRDRWDGRERTERYIPQPSMPVYQPQRPDDRYQSDRGGRDNRQDSRGGPPQIQYEQHGRGENKGRGHGNSGDDERGHGRR